MFKFLHAADLHLDSPLRGLDRYEGCPADEVRGATRRAVENLVRLAVGERVAFVLIAGDVYDGDWKDHNTGLWFVRRMAELRDAGIAVFLIRGNHDAKNRMTRDLRWPDNVRSLDVHRPQTCTLDDVPVAVHGQGFATASVTDDLAAAYPVADRGCFNIGLLHTSVNGREGHDPYAPCTVESLRLKGYGYWALGHVHTRETLDDRDGPIVFPGNIQGRHAREGGAKGCVVVTVDDGGQVASAEFRPLDVLRWGTCRLDAATAATGDDLLLAFEDALPALIDAADGRALALRVEIVGASKLHDRLAADPRSWAYEVRNQVNIHGNGRVWVEKVGIRTRPLVAGDGPMAAEPAGPSGELGRLVAELLGDEARLRAFADRELGDLRRKLPPDLRLDDVGHLGGDGWLRALLGEVGPLLDERFAAVAAPAPGGTRR